jgi:hypothetical protein
MSKLTAFKDQAAAQRNPINSITELINTRLKSYQPGASAVMTMSIRSELRNEQRDNWERWSILGSLPR